MNRNSPIPLWVVLCVGVVLLCGIYLFGKPGMVVPQVNVAMRQLTPLPQTNATASTLTPIASSETTFSKAENPELYITATSRRINPPAQNLQSYPEFSYYGLTFRSPWQETPEIKQGKASVHLQFTGSKTIVLSKTVAGGEWVTAVLRDPQMAGYVSLGQEHFGSNYDLRKYLYSITPDIISSTPKAALAAVNELFMWKQRVGINENPIYTFETTDIRGFQYGDPAGKESLTLELFDKQDNFFTLFIGNNVTQEDVDFILASVTSQ